MSSTEGERRKELETKLLAKVEELLPQGQEVTPETRKRYREGMRDFFRKELFAVAAPDPLREQFINILADLMTGHGERSLVLRMFEILNKKPNV